MGIPQLAQYRCPADPSYGQADLCSTTRIPLLSGRATGNGILSYAARRTFFLYSPKHPRRIAPAFSEHPTWEGFTPMNDSKEPSSGMSRRRFLQGSGVAAAATALGTEALPGLSAAQPEPAVPAMGPGAVKITLNVNGQKLTTAI